MIANWPVSSDGAGWAVLQLVEDDIAVADLDEDLSYLMPGVIVYVPAVREWMVDSRSALSTYAFVLANQKHAAIQRLKQSRFVAEILTLPNRKLALVSDAELADMVRVEPSPDLAPGLEVEVTSGDFEGMTGTIESVTPERAFVSITLRSSVKTVEIPVGDLRPVAAA